MMAAAPEIPEGLVAGDINEWPARVVVIANPGDDAKSACFQALGSPGKNIRRRSNSTPWDCVEFSSKDWNKHLRCGFNSSDVEDEAFEEVLAITKIMSEKLD